MTLCNPLPVAGQRRHARPAAPSVPALETHVDLEGKRRTAALQKSLHAVELRVLERKLFLCRLV